MSEMALFEYLPKLRERIATVALGKWPTPLQPLTIAEVAGREVFAKREDLSSPRYGGNKVRTLELLFAEAMRCNRKRVWSTGAYGSNHALASALHARHVGLATGALLFPQPATRPAVENLAQLVAMGDVLHPLRTILSFPFRLWLLSLRAKREGDYIMQPGGATPLGALGHVGAALELCDQIRRGDAPWPAHLLVPCGSACTAAGLLAGLLIARARGLWAGELSMVHALRVTPWPVTARSRVLSLAKRTLALLDASGASGATRSMKGAGRLLRVHGKYLGRGYGWPTPAGLRVMDQWGEAGPFALETTYSAKAVAGLVDLVRRLDGPIVFWATKSSAPLPVVDMSRLAGAPAHVRRWMARVNG